MANKYYMYSNVNEKTMDGIIQEVEDCLQKENMETQRVETDNSNDCIVQARARMGKAKQMVGMDKAITVHIALRDDGVRIQMGEEKWMDKGIVLSISMFVLWPLAISSSVGIYQQKKLPSLIVKAIDAYMGEQGQLIELDSEHKVMEKAEKVANAVTHELRQHGGFYAYKAFEALKKSLHI